jgi:hypothetical protein
VRPQSVGSAYVRDSQDSVDGYQRQVYQHTVPPSHTTAICSMACRAACENRFLPDFHRFPHVYAAVVFQCVRLAHPGWLERDKRATRRDWCRSPAGTNALR